MQKKHSVYDLDVDTKYMTMLLDISINGQNALIYKDKNTLMDMLCNSTLWYKHGSASDIMAQLTPDDMNEYLLSATNVGSVLNEYYNTTVFASGNFEEVYRQATLADLSILDGGFKQGYKTFVEKNLIMNTTNAGYYFNKLFNMDCPTIVSKKSLLDCLKSKSFMQQVHDNKKMLQLFVDYDGKINQLKAQMRKSTTTYSGNGNLQLPDDVYLISFNLKASGGAVAQSTFSSNISQLINCGLEESSFGKTCVHNYRDKNVTAYSNGKTGSSIVGNLFLKDKHLISYTNSNCCTSLNAGTSYGSSMTVDGNVYKCYGGGSGAGSAYTVTTYRYCCEKGTSDGGTYRNVAYQYLAAYQASSPVAPSISTPELLGKTTYSSTGGSACTQAGNLTIDFYYSDEE